MSSLLQGIPAEVNCLASRLARLQAGNGTLTCKGRACLGAARLLGLRLRHAPVLKLPGKKASAALLSGKNLDLLFDT